MCFTLGFLIATSRFNRSNETYLILLLFRTPPILTIDILSFFDSIVVFFVIFVALKSDTPTKIVFIGHFELVFAQLSSTDVVAAFFTAWKLTHFFSLIHSRLLLASVIDHYSSQLVQVFAVLFVCIECDSCFHGSRAILLGVLFMFSI